MTDSRADEKVAMLQGEVDNLNQKVAFLEQKLKELEQNRRIPRGPWDVGREGWEPAGPGMPPAPIFEYKTHCSKCGLKTDGPLGYVCPNRDCPVGLGPVWCGGTPT